MLKSRAVEHYGSQAAVAEALGLSRAAINKWNDVIPLESARALEIRSGGALTVDESLYPALAKAHAQFEAHQSA
jgi:hypothetical protein